VTDYITLQDYKNRYRITTDEKDVALTAHISAASRKVDQICHRSFASQTAAASARYFRPLNCSTVLIDDAYSITSVAVDEADGGTWATNWPSTDYDTDPANGIGPDGQSGWPTTALHGLGNLSLPTTGYRRAVKVTAKWGWAAVPDVVAEATYLLAARLAYEVAVPGGVLPPNLEFGLPGAPLQRPYTAEGLLKLHMRADKVIGVAG
jgi:hypothetical protein